VLSASGCRNRTLILTAPGHDHQIERKDPRPTSGRPPCSSRPHDRGSGHPQLRPVASNSVGSDELRRAGRRGRCRRNLYATEFSRPSLQRIDRSTGARTTVSATSGGAGKRPQPQSSPRSGSRVRWQAADSYPTAKPFSRIDRQTATGHTCRASALEHRQSGPAFPPCSSLCLEGENGVLVLDSGAGTTVAGPCSG
jgi:hypothetical protein